jgi:hypothetical protein
MRNENTDWKEFDAQLLKVHSIYINPAVESAVARARAEIGAQVDTLIYALLTQALNLCFEVEPDQRKAYSHFAKRAEEILDLHSIPSALNGHPEKDGAA